MQSLQLVMNQAKKEFMSKSLMPQSSYWFIHQLLIFAEV